jgi:molecular chaperone DnaK
MEPVIGIDLGTTFSCVAHINEGTPTVIPNKGYKTTPSVVAFTESGKRLVGYPAKRQVLTNADNTVFAAKRLIGRRWNSEAAQHVAQTVPYKLTEGATGDVCVELRGKAYTIPEISSYIIHELKMVAEAHVNDNIARGVITVPAYFNDSQRQATRDAGAIAGLDVLAIINEPTAAALAYGYERELDKRVAVYDLGGGTFDISILDIKGGDFKVISTAGDSFLGGEDFDARLVDHLNRKFMEQHGVDLKKDPISMQRLREAAEKAKCDLSSAMDVEVSIPFVAIKENNEALHLRYMVNRQQLENMVLDLVEKTFVLCQQAMDNAGIPKDSIEDVLLVGGQTRMPLVRERVKRFYGLEPSKKVHPDEAVALGAAIHGHNLQQVKSEVHLMDVTPQSLGIVVAGGYIKPVIRRNSPVPTSRSRVFTTARDNQKQVKIVIVQGDNPKAQDNELLGEFMLDGLREGPRGSVEIMVNFSINSDGIVNVTATDAATGTQQAVTVTARSGLTEDEIRRMTEENRDYTLESKTSEEQQKIMHDARTLLSEMEKLRPLVQKALAGEQDFLTDIMGKADAMKQDVDRALGTNDLDRITTLIEPLDRLVKMFANLSMK